MLARALLLASLAAAQAFAQGVKPPPPVAGVGDVSLPVGGGLLALYVSLDWTVRQPAVTRAVVLVHGLQRDADVSFATLEAARALAEADSATVVLVAPQFLASVDPGDADLLRWGWNDWAAGADAQTPAPVSSFAAMDAVLRHVSDPGLFPALRTIVIGGFSAGGQFVQRYAAVGHAGRALPAGLALRYVVGSPSSYLYFSADRSGPVAGCPDYNDWRFGLGGRLPAYIGANPDAAALEHAYASARIIYLLGGADTDPAQPALDRGCGAEAQGPTRLARGIAFTDYLMARDPAAHAQKRWIIPGVGHSERRILTSACGVASLFDTPGCAFP